MAEPVWNKFLTERDKLVFDAAGYGQRAGFGERPAVVVIDVNYNFTGDKPEPILESIKRWPNSCGEDGWEWLEIYHSGTVPIDLAGFSLGWAGTSYANDTAQLSGTINPGEVWVIGGPSSGANNANPTNDLRLDSGGRVQCLSCHGVHYADSNTQTVDEP